MERRLRIVWWVALAILVAGAAWKLFIVPGSNSAFKAGAVNVEERRLVVYVTGAVEKPGLVRLPLDARLDDALKEAKPLPEAELEQINPAQRLKDGQKITIPYKAGAVGITQGVSEGSAQDPAQGVSQGSAQDPVQGVQPNSGTKININTAGTAELDKLPGIGPALAERIIQYRTENGPFVQPEDLMNVSGIGPKTYEKMSSMVTVGL